MIRAYILIFSVLILLSNCDIRHKSNKDVLSPIISVTELSQRLEQLHAYKLLEVSPIEEYEKGHISTALHIWRPQYESNDSIKGMRADRVKMADQLALLGISSSDTIVLYDHAANVDACRLFWILDMYGHPNLRILDGGKKAWITHGFGLSGKRGKAENSEFQFIEDIEFELLATHEDLTKALHQSDVEIIDTRTDEEFLGQPFLFKGSVVDWKPGAHTQGTIRGARHFHWTRCSHFETPYGFKSAKDIQHEFKASGIDPFGNMIVFCQSGARSAHTWFVLKYIVGNDRVKNYDGSWIEWSQRFQSQDTLISRHSTVALNKRMTDSLNQIITIPNG